MKISAVVPMRHSSERVKGKNYRPLNGRPLYQWIISTLLEVKAIDEVVIDTDSDVIRDDAARVFPSVRVLERPEHLRAGEIPMNDVLLNTVRQLEGDVVLQTHSTNPFLTAASIERGIAAIERDDCDSVFGVTRLQARLWAGPTEPINHDPAVLLRTQDLAPVYLENSTLYLFGKEDFVKAQNRIGKKPALVEVDFPEALDIDEERDFSMADALARVLEAKA